MILVFILVPVLIVVAIVAYRYLDKFDGVPPSKENGYNARKK